MKFVRFGGGRTGLVVDADGHEVLDILASLPGLSSVDPAAAVAIGGVLTEANAQDWTDMIRDWDGVRGSFQSLEGLARTRGSNPVITLLDAPKLEAPIASPSTHIYAVGSNTAEHIVRAFKAMANLDLTHEQAFKSKREGRPPFGFMVWPSTVVGPEAAVSPPRGTLKFDYEGECAVYVKTGGRYLDRVDLWGYTAFNDLGVRDTHLKLAPEADWGPFSLNTPKNFDGGKACGPWVCVDEVSDLSTLRCVVTVNGAKRQDWLLSEMIYGFDEVLTFLSRSISLKPGDMLASGTGAGIAIEGGVDGPDWLAPGDVIEIRLDGAGVLRNVVAAW